jgi:hypothetical protein
MEMDFIEEFQNAGTKLNQIRKIKQKKDQSFSSMDFVKSAASAGKLSSEVNQIVDGLLQHNFLMANGIDLPALSLAVAADLIHVTGISIHVAKRLVDLACYKLDGQFLAKSLYIIHQCLVIPSQHQLFSFFQTHQFW